MAHAQAQVAKVASVVKYLEAKVEEAKSEEKLAAEPLSQAQTSADRIAAQHSTAQNELAEAAKALEAAKAKAENAQEHAGQIKAKADGYDHASLHAAESRVQTAQARIVEAKLKQHNAESALKGLTGLQEQWQGAVGGYEQRLALAKARSAAAEAHVAYVAAMQGALVEKHINALHTQELERVQKTLKEREIAVSRAKALVAASTKAVRTGALNAFTGGLLRRMTAMPFSILKPKESRIMFL